MSYVRWSAQSHVYVYLDVGGFLICCGCCDDRVPRSFRAYTTAEMIDHLREHVAAGDLVPESCFDGLRNDADENDGWIQEQSA